MLSSPSQSSDHYHHSLFWELTHFWFRWDGKTQENIIVKNFWQSKYLLTVWVLNSKAVTLFYDAIDKKVWNISKLYKREQRLKSWKMLEFWKSKNFENQRILKIKEFWKSKNFKNPRLKRLESREIKICKKSLKLFKL